MNWIRLLSARQEVVWISFASCFFFGACASSELDHSSPQEKVGSRSCSQRYIPIGPRVESSSVTYQSARDCSGGEQPGATALGDYLSENFGSMMNLTSGRRGIEIYNCRSVRGGRARSLHSEGARLMYISTAWTLTTVRISSHH